jgi:alpha-D-ribose 1-methylphosphonate 5-triphosphate diphosphatase PhnM
MPRGLRPALGGDLLPGLEGDYLLPGLVEMHTDNFERHLMPRPKVHWAELPALLAHDAEIAAAGITTVFDALGVGEADPESLRASAWDGVLRTIDSCTRQDLLRADHHRLQDGLQPGLGLVHGGGVAHSPAST